MTDPQLTAPPPAVGGPDAALHAFLTGPFQRYLYGLQSLSLSAELDFASCPVPGSYAVDWRVRVRTRNQPDRVFSLGGLRKRYEPAPLAACLLTLGWRVLRQWPDEAAKLLLLLCRKLDSPS